MEKKKLFPYLEGGSYAEGALGDEYYRIAYDIEEALMMAGAEPGKDYTYMDIMKLAEPLVRELYKKGKITEIAVAADNVLSDPHSSRR